MPLRRCIAVIGVALVVALSSLPSDAAGAPSHDPAKFVKWLGDEAIAILSTPNATPEERKERYRDLLDRGFAVDTIARFVLGRHWRAATSEQRAQYRRLFREYVLDTYAERLEGYAGQTFEILKAVPLNDVDTIVRTEIRQPNGPPIRVDYRVRQRSEAFKVIDVQVEGVSLITTQRSEFNSIIARDGIDGLLELLREYGPDVVKPK
ncbi:MAG: ABC transporter substrate-binding protein [Proteobacteria bacterium]|nr:ABC transporter substrate-binding protein [Pseudomonadota bacterium]